MSAAPLAISPHRRALPAVTGVMRRLFSFPAALAAGLIFLEFWIWLTGFDDPDLWWHLKVGEVIWSTHHLPIADQYSFSAFGHAWIAHEWLSELVLFTVYKAGGYRGLMLGMCAIASAYVVLTYLLSVSWSGNWKVSFLGGILALWFLTVTLAIRPALLSHLFLALELLLLSTGVARLSRIAWALPVLFAVWANCHGSYLFGLGLLTIAVAWRCLKLDQGRLVLACDRSTTIRLLMIWVFSLFAPFVNPVGASLLVYPINLLRQHPESVSSVQE